MNFVNFFFKNAAKKHKDLFPNYQKEKSIIIGVRVSGTAHACAKVIRGSKINPSPCLWASFHPPIPSLSVVSALRKKRKDRMKLSLPPKLMVL
jgi:hypothetical protein